MEMLDRISMAAQECGQLRTDIIFGLYHKHISFFLYAGYARLSADLCQYLVITRVYLQFQGILCAILYLMSQILDLATGYQIAIDKNTYPVTDLLYLIQLMG